MNVMERTKHAVFKKLRKGRIYFFRSSGCNFTKITADLPTFIILLQNCTRNPQKQTH